MCTPLLAGAGLQLGGSLLGGIGQMRGADAAADAERYNIAIMENDIRQLNQQAAEQKSTLGLQSAQQLAAGQTSFAAGNVNVLTGSASDWATDVDLALKTDLATVDTSTRRKTSRLRAEQALASSRASSAERAGRFGLGTSLLSGAAKVGFAFA